ncbi:hypothetical protein BDP55DRAFT_126307 [Colletotrichum godetiae]|uniref:Uncharacterized protein n=1 Tax=Colletotrichum godetiae TaxID=1209918 RepID=A0AAJ0F4C4_9PEZI|nr:uncharacterized protein BDP55DRAFT_126307 [Colletotrichum godetiae]KAK1700305.1 hypothetical protein BDP55DRAFT_126307 [Colletotrichum godetiae]
MRGSAALRHCGIAALRLCDYSQIQHQVMFSLNAFSSHHNLRYLMSLFVILVRCVRQGQSLPTQRDAFVRSFFSLDYLVLL